jgi:hypothetical protein
MDEEVPPQFFELVDQFINLANASVEQHGPARVSACILFAAARYNAFRLQSGDPDAEANREAAVSYFVNQYRQMLEDNIDGLREHRDAGRDRPAG